MSVEIKRGLLQFAFLRFIVLLMFLPTSESSPICNGGCCPNYYLDHSGNDCIPCEKGYFGLNCSSRCPSSFYGLR
ncbi:uncharacterized protein LOC134263332 isoform X2 [Saccostrea cucullata]